LEPGHCPSRVHTNWTVGPPFSGRYLVYPGPRHDLDFCPFFIFGLGVFYKYRFVQKNLYRKSLGLGGPYLIAEMICKRIIIHVAVGPPQS
jgi:hypothetical protein